MSGYRGQRAEAALSKVTWNKEPIGYRVIYSASVDLIERKNYHSFR